MNWKVAWTFFNPSLSLRWEAERSDLFASNEVMWFLLATNMSWIKILNVTMLAGVNSASEPIDQMKWLCHRTRSNTFVTEHRKSLFGTGTVYIFQPGGIVLRYNYLTSCANVTKLRIHSKIFHTPSTTKAAISPMSEFRQFHGQV